MSLLAVEEALARILADAVTLESEPVSLIEAAGRVLSENVPARLTQPPFNASAMDGYAVRAADVATLPAILSVIGESAAGHAFSGQVGPRQAVRIFTGAPVPDGADAIVIQENVTKRQSSNDIAVVDGQPDAAHIRRRGGDFAERDIKLRAGQRLTARDLLLAAAMGYGTLPVVRRPKVAILATGDELVEPGEALRPDQIISSNPFGLAAMMTNAGAAPRLLGIARDTLDSLAGKIEDAADADILLTIGGASVGDHDLVVPALKAAGMSLDFWKIAMRPGKPMIYGHRGGQRVLGLPGNPVSSMICARVFGVPLVWRYLGLTADNGGGPKTAILGAPICANGPRAHYMRAKTLRSGANAGKVVPIDNQDSSLIAPLAEADCLIVRAPRAPAADTGAIVDTLPLDF